MDQGFTDFWGEVLVEMGDALEVEESGVGGRVGAGGEAVCADVLLAVLRYDSNQRSVQPNRTFSNMVESVQRLSLNPRLEEAEIQFEEREEKLKLFCEMDQRAICVVCAVFQHHKAHSVIPIKEAAELRKRQAERLRKNIDVVFAKRHKVLTEEQRDLITKLRQKEEVILGQIENNKIHIFKQIASINQRIAEIQTRLTLPSTEFLKDIKSIIDRAGVEIKKPTKVAVDVAERDLIGPLQSREWKLLLKGIIAFNTHSY
eukprot:gi/632955169/ref/XP_007893337.1/ PREDICTED: E3 ubiquitin-protein ligase TRIM39-like [Callorhinchus milii]